MGRCAGLVRPTVNSNVRAEAILLARSMYLLCPRFEAGKYVSVQLETVAVSPLCRLFMFSISHQIVSIHTPPPDGMCDEERSSRPLRACNQPLSQCAIVSASFLFPVHLPFFCARAAPGTRKGLPDAIGKAASHTLAAAARPLLSLVEKSTPAQLFLSCVHGPRVAPTAAPCETPPP